MALPGPGGTTKVRVRLRDIYDDPNVRSQRMGDQTLVWVDL